MNSKYLFYYSFRLKILLVKILVFDVNEIFFFTSALLYLFSANTVSFFFPKFYFLFFRESAISGDEETVTTPVFDYSNEKSLTELKASTMTPSWNASDTAVEMLSAASNTAACTLYNLPESTVASDDQNPAVSNLSEDSAYDIIL